MDNNQSIIDQLSQQAVLVLFFHKDKNVCVGILRALYNAGVRIVEFTNRGKEAVDNFKYMKEVRDSELPGLLLSAGTIKTVAHARDFISAGADFIISPGLNEEVGALVHQHKLLWIPGCMTPSEIMKAEEAGARVVKLFPGSLLGPGFVSAIKELFPSLYFIPTGGVSVEKENLSAWFKSGVIAVGAGSTLISKPAVDGGEFGKIETAAAAAVALAREVKDAVTR